MENKSLSNQLKEIRRFKVEHFFELGHGELTKSENQLLNVLITASSHLRNNETIPPIILLEIFLLTHETEHPQLSFVMEWLYQGALSFQQSEGTQSFERGLGFTKNEKGGPLGQGNEFKRAWKERQLNLKQLLLWIACLNKFEGYSVEGATEIVSLICEREDTGEKYTYETLLGKYKSWKNKRLVEDEDVIAAWQRYRQEWIKLFDFLETGGEKLPSPKRPKKGEANRRG